MSFQTVLDQIQRAQTEQIRFSQIKSLIQRIQQEPSNLSKLCRLLFECFRYARDSNSLVHTETMEYFLNEIKEKPNQPFTYHIYGVFLQCIRQLEQSEKMYLKAIELANQNHVQIRPEYLAQFHIELGSLHFSRNRYEKAEPFYLKSLEICPNNARYHMEFGTLLHDSGQHERAENHLRQAVQLDPTEPEAWSNLGDFLCDRGELDESEMIYRRGLEIGQNCTKVHNGLAVLLHSYKGELTESEQLYLKAISLDPRDPINYMNFAMLLKEKGQMVEAETVMKHVMALDTGDAFSRLKYAQFLHFDMGDFEGAEAEYMTALALDQDMGIIYNEYGVLLYECKRYEECKSLFQKAINLNHVQSHLNLAKLLLDPCVGSTDINDAEHFTRRALVLSPNNLPAHKVLTDVLCIRGTVWSLREAVSLCSKILARPNLKASEKKPFQTQSEKLLLKLVESEKQQQEKLEMIRKRTSAKLLKLNRLIYTKLESDRKRSVARSVLHIVGGEFLGPQHLARVEQFTKIEIPTPVITAPSPMFQDRPRKRQRRIEPDTFGNFLDFVFKQTEQTFTEKLDLSEMSSSRRHTSKPRTHVRQNSGSQLDAPEAIQNSPGLSMRH